MNVKRRPLLVGLGHAYRSDDALGPKAIEVLRRTYGDRYEYLTHSGDPADLMERWQGRDVVVIDALQTPVPEPGRLHRFRPLENPIFPMETVVSSHALSLSDALELGRILGQLPETLTVLGVEGENFAPSEALSPAVAASLDDLVSILPQVITQEESHHA